MQSLVQFLFERWRPALARISALRGADAGTVVSPANGAAPAPTEPDVCRLCREPIEDSDTVAASADDVVHTVCYDRSLETQPSDTHRAVT